MADMTLHVERDTLTVGAPMTPRLLYQREGEYLALVRVRIAQGRSAPERLLLHETARLIERLLRAAESSGRAKMRSRFAFSTR